jgi:stringent starvation protein B
VKELSTTPYLIRALYEWCCDSGLTPYITVKTDATTKVPVEYVKNGEIVLNIGADATRNLKIGNDLVQFSARFGGVSREISVPVNAIAGVFAKENGHGMAFQVAPSPADAEIKLSDKPVLRPPGNDPPKGPGKGGRARLQVIK